MATPPVPAWLLRAQRRAPQGVVVAQPGPGPSIGGVVLQPHGRSAWVVKTSTTTSTPLRWNDACALARDARRAGANPVAVVAPGCSAPRRDETWLKLLLAAATRASAGADGRSFARVANRAVTTPSTGPLAVAPTLESLAAVLIPGATTTRVSVDVAGAVAAAVARVGVDGVAGALATGSAAPPPEIVAVLDAAAAAVGRPFVPAATQWAPPPRLLKRPRLDAAGVADAVLAAVGPPIIPADAVEVTVPPAAWPTVVRAAAKALRAVSRPAPRGGVFVLWRGKVLCNGVDGVGALLAAVALAAAYRLRDDARDFVAPESAAAQLPLAPPRRRSTASGSASAATMAAASAAVAALGMDAMGLSPKQLRATIEYLAWMLHKDVAAKPGPPCHSADRQRGHGCLKCAGIEVCRAATGSDAMDEPGATPCSVVAATLERPPCLTITEAKLAQRTQLASAALTAHKVMAYAAQPQCEQGLNQ